MIGQLLAEVVADAGSVERAASVLGVSLDVLTEWVRWFVSRGSLDAASERWPVAPPRDQVAEMAYIDLVEAIERGGVDGDNELDPPSVRDVYKVRVDSWDRMEAELLAQMAIYGGASGNGVGAKDSPVEPKEAQIDELRERIVQAKAFCKQRGVDIDELREGGVLARLAKLEAAIDALIFPDDVRRQFLAVADRVDRLLRAIGLDEQVEEFVKDRGTLHKLAGAIRARMDPTDISAVMGEVEELLDVSIGAKGYVIREPKALAAMDSGLPYRADHCIDLGKIDFDALAAFFKKNKSPRATIAALQQTARKKLEELVRNNPTRKDLHAKLEELIADYNEGSHNVQESFEAIRKFIEELSEEEQRHVKEECSEEELAVFDLLIKPGLELSRKERKQVKALAKELLNKLKVSKFTLDWKKTRSRRAAVRTTIMDVLDALPEAYSDDMYDAKCDAVYEHVFESYYGDGASKYSSQERQAPRSGHL